MTSVHAGKRNGFTLVEMVVSLGLAVTILVMVAELLEGAMTGVSDGESKVVSSEKVAELTRVLASDLGALPVLDAPAFALLQSSGSTRKWELRLMLPATPEGEGASWSGVTYTWSADDGSLWREETTKSPGTSRSEGRVLLASGVVSLSTDWLTEAGALDGGTANWHDGEKLPVALRLRAEVSGIREEGERVGAISAAGRHRSFERTFKVSGGDAP